MAVADNVTRKEHNIEGNCLFDVWNACVPARRFDAMFVATRARIAR
jgi:hypothetical protein